MKNSVFGFYQLHNLTNYFVFQIDTLAIIDKNEKVMANYHVIQCKDKNFSCTAAAMISWSRTGQA